ncbi:helix-turn-helix transcriptional regulator [Blastococcus sp. KM273128]|uniref:helix-turn-helix domain-containing protein n=1 Tax=Blastococcus sp. KM273128 TaxID=2570314 RepID=UPI0027DF234C|nr:helix-turn-helix transcriptional regulator [Blastococcus sp. KM273128]MCF6745068.1 helix-turn-helix transcriptional regulator [Blastococcus sp. KM273128]
MSPRRDGPAPDDDAGHRVVCHLDRLLEERGMTLVELSERVGVSVVNLSVLKNGRARAVRFSTLTAVCDALGCQPGELFSVSPERADSVG